MYSIAAASRLSGVHPETLRAWERRYDIVCPRRDSRGCRVYASEDVERLKLLRQATDLGHPIGRLADLDLEGLRQVAEQAAHEPGHSGEIRRMVCRIVDAVERYRPDECNQELGLAATLLEPDCFTDKVIAPALEAVSERARLGEMSVAQEHVLNCCIRCAVLALLGAYQSRATGPTMILATLPGEKHELGVLITAMLAAADGMDCVYLGPDIPPEDLVVAAIRTKARCVALSCTLEQPPAGLQETLVGLARALPQGCELWMGGKAAAQLDVQGLPPTCICVSNLRDFKRCSSALKDSP